MLDEDRNTFIGSVPLQRPDQPASGSYVQLWGEEFYQIAHYNQIPPFFMSLVSSADHWLFIASNGGLTAGRINAESALFPYETEDKIMAGHEHTGSKTVIALIGQGKRHIWEPFSERYAGIYRLEHHLYKNIYGNKLIFEEINLDLGLVIRIAWRTSDRFGFVRTTEIVNLNDDTSELQILDGVQNVLPHGATVQLQTNMSNLLHAYKRSELVPGTGVGIYALSATLTDRPEPSESLKATIVWQSGLKVAAHLLCSQQVDAFRRGTSITSEQDICGRAGAYLACATLSLPGGASKRWHIVADVNYDAAAIAQLNHFLNQSNDQIERILEAEISASTSDLKAFVAASDGLQFSQQTTVSAHHYANTLFNIMRGGIFPDGYQIAKDDFCSFVLGRDQTQMTLHQAWFDGLPEKINVQTLQNSAIETGSPDIIRLSLEYLPLMFSRRHGDPSRPWNQFSINLKHTDGSPRLDFQGNWRDIFQNWEPLMLNFPEYLPNVIGRFLNATTADGYNPYRVTRSGIEWEVPEPDNPWSNIGYWSDHQIIYLQKLLELGKQIDSSTWSQLQHARVFAYADVPYRLRSYEEMQADWYNTISFDRELEQAIEQRVGGKGSDGRLVHNGDGEIVYATLTEKLLTLLLAKVTNFVPEGGIWMNTQRPEWNDANNALVGKGLSIVTTAYIHRFIKFWLGQLENDSAESYEVNTAVAELYSGIHTVLSAHSDQLSTGFQDHARKLFMDSLGSLATTYRTLIYEMGIPGTQAKIGKADLTAFLTLVQRYVVQTLRTNQRSDGLYHAYNILDLKSDRASINRLYLMLEGQVAILSSGLLSPEETVILLDALRESDLFRPDQHSYMLYPNRRLSGFLQKNNISADQAQGSELAMTLAAAGDKRLLVEDVEGTFHFNGTFRNAEDVLRVLDELAKEPDYSEMVQQERTFILSIFEDVFVHRAFTGRSGTFFAYEGLGSIYWHMVAKLLLATQEIYLAAEASGADSALLMSLASAYRDIRQGIGYKRSPTSYGAFPTDPYSHTPISGGARQPGMTGQVKEEILTRWGELGLKLNQGQLHFKPTLLDLEEFSKQSATFEYVDVDGEDQAISVPVDALAFTFCQTPIIYSLGGQASVTVHFRDGKIEVSEGTQLNHQNSQLILGRTSTISHLVVTVPIEQLRPSLDPVVTP